MDPFFPRTSRIPVVLTAYVVLIWFALAVVGSIFGSFVPKQGTPPLAFGLTVIGPVILFVTGYLLSGAFRGVVRSLIGDPWGITALQAYRVLGVVFIVLASRNLLPAVFALPAGWGDIFIGVTAPLVALAWSSNTKRGNVVFVLWNALGMLDLIVAVSLGILAPFIQPAGRTTTSLLMFPLSLIPTFAVPLSFLLHVAGLGQLWRAPRKQEG